MIMLAKHIETLLLDNDCVVVPNFGGFIAHYQPAYFDDKSSKFFPPQRVIGFNPKLTMNDGLLVQSYMQDLDTDFSDANFHIEQEVDELKEQLFKDGVVCLMNIGRISCGSDGSLFFVPSEKVIETPNLYGLSDFQCNVVSNRKSRFSIHSSYKTESTLSKESSKSSHSIGHSFIGSALGVAVALFLFFFLSVPVENSYVDNGNYAYLGDAGLFSSIKSKSFIATVFDMPSTASTSKTVSSKTKSNANKQAVIVSSAKPEVKKVVVADKSERLEKASEETPREENAIKTQDKKYHVIVSSTSSEEEAQRLVSQLHKKGYDEAFIIPGKGYYKYRISIFNLDDESSAYNKINQLKNERTFDDAWVLSSK